MVLPPGRVLDAVAIATRVPRGRLSQRRGPVRTLLVRALRQLTATTDREVARLADVSLRTVERERGVDDHRVRAVAAVAVDERIPPLVPLPVWLSGTPYRGTRRCCA